MGASGATTVVQRFMEAQATNIATAKTLVDQTYVHAFQQNIPDKAVWQSAWNQMLSRANATLRPYMNAKLGSPAPSPSSIVAPSAPPPPPTAPYQPPATTPVPRSIWDVLKLAPPTPTPPVAAQIVAPVAPSTQVTPVAVPVPDASTSGPEATAPVLKPGGLVAGVSPLVLVGLGVGALLLLRGRH